MKMNKLVFKNNNQAVTSSISISENFNKGHNHVLRDIRNLQKDVSNFGQMFFETTEPDSYGRPRKIYLMNRDGFTLLAMGFTGAKAMEFKMAYINEFNKMEQFLNSPEMIVQRAMQIQQKKIEKLESEKKELLPKATYHDLVLQSDTLLTVTQIAKDYGMGAPTLNKILYELGIQYKKGHRWYLYHPYQDKGYTQAKTNIISADETKEHMYWTQKSRLLIYETHKKKKGILPIVEREQQQVAQ